MLAGCGGKKADLSTPAACLATLTAAIESGDFATAAACFEYDEQAKKQNEDWESIASGQRKLIIGKLRERKAGALQSAAQQYLGLGYEIGTVNESSGQATVQLKAASGGTVTAKLLQREGKWEILELPGL